MPTPKPKRRRSSVFLLILVFAIPVIGAYYLYFHPDVLKKRTTNKGHLIKKPLDFYRLPLQPQGFALAQLKGKWLMVYVSPETCEKLCMRNLYYMRQIKTATYRDTHRVERVILTFTREADPGLKQLLSTDYQGTYHLEVPRAAFSEFILPLTSKKIALTTGALYLIDPNGNMMMSYAPDANPGDILKDLTKLLKFSQIG